MLAVTLRENALTTLDALKTSLGIDPAEEDAQRDATLVQLINAASAWLETQLGRKLGNRGKNIAAQKCRNFVAGAVSH